MWDLIIAAGDVVHVVYLSALLHDGHGDVGQLIHAAIHWQQWGYNPHLMSAGKMLGIVIYQ